MLLYNNCFNKLNKWTLSIRLTGASSYLPDKGPLLHWASLVCTGAPLWFHSGISVSLVCPTPFQPPQHWFLHQSSAEKILPFTYIIISYHLHDWLKIKRKSVPVFTLSMAFPTFDTLPWMSLCREASICTVSFMFLQHWVIVCDRTDKSLSWTPERKKTFSLETSAMTNPRFVIIWNK